MSSRCIGYTTRPTHEPIDSLRAMFCIFLWLVAEQTALTIFTRVSYREPCRLIMSGGRLIGVRPNMSNRFRFPIAFRCFRYPTSSFFPERICRSTFLNHAIAG